jgi:hypothetical protein
VYEVGKWITSVSELTVDFATKWEDQQQKHCSCFGWCIMNKAFELYHKFKGGHELEDGPCAVLWNKDSVKPVQEVVPSDHH